MSTHLSLSSNNYIYIYFNVLLFFNKFQIIIRNSEVQDMFCKSESKLNSKYINILSNLKTSTVICMRALAIGRAPSCRFHQLLNPLSTFTL